ncbi:pilus assembly protein TadG-related protein [Desulfitobacterium sp. Sab5]|uniref:pilus assembly protein TadG-related protein n=1 Tax=Desulfitobacterium nosdiversum TaxID=3375356 RepID=UPI003CF3AD36
MLFKKWTKNFIIKINMNIGAAHSRSDMTSSCRGSIAILVAIGLTVLLGCGAMVTDVGLIYAEKAKLQNAVDAAALAGVQELPNNPDGAVQIAQDYAQQNGADTISYSFEADNKKMDVSAQKDVPTYFAKIWGINSEQITAAAQAMMLPPTAMTGAVPLSVQDQPLIFGQEYTLKAGAGDGTDGWYGALQLSAPGAKSYQTDLTYGYSGSIKVGQVLSIEPGNISGPTKKAIEDRFAMDTRVPRNTYTDYDRNAPEILYIPIVKVVSYQSSTIHEVQVTGFAAFFVENVTGNGNESIVTGRFLKTLTSNGKTGGSLTDLLKEETDINNGTSAEDFGLYTPKLISQ